MQAADQKMKEANKRAADAAFQSNNHVGARESDTVDLHGLYVEEALNRLKTRLDDARQEARLLTPATNSHTVKLDSLASALWQPHCRVVFWRSR